MSLLDTPPRPAHRSHSFRRSSPVTRSPGGAPTAPERRSHSTSAAEAGATATAAAAAVGAGAVGHTAQAMNRRQPVNMTWYNMTEEEAIIATSFDRVVKIGRVDQRRDNLYSEMATGDYYITVQRILSRVTGSTLQTFSRCKTDEERMSYILSLDYVNDAFSLNVKGTAKIGLEALNSRKKGNDYYAKELYTDAKDMYTRSVVFAPASGTGGEYGDELSLAYANRSAAMFQLNEYRLALVDIKRAFDNGYQGGLQYKLYDRQGKCLMELGSFSTALDAFNRALHSLTLSKLDNKKRDSWRWSIEKLISICERNLANNPSASNGTSPLSCGSFLSCDTSSNGSLETIGASSDMFPCASNAFNVKCNIRQGRYGFAARNVSIGELMVAESPYVFVPSPDARNKRCYWCFNNTLAPIGCKECSLVRYCDEECREAAWSSFHKYECKYLGLIEASGIGLIGHLALKLVLTTSLEQIQSKRKKLERIYHTSSESDMKSSDPTRKLPILVNGESVYTGGYETLYTLMTHSSLRNSHELFQYSLLSVFLLKILQESKFLPERKMNKNKTEENKENLDNNNDVFKENKPASRKASFKKQGSKCEEFIPGVDDAFIGGILLRFLQIISCNGIEIMETRSLGDVQRAEQTTHGLALYATVSLLNHSCNPNLELVFYGNKCAVRAIRSIHQGEELTIDYGYVYYLTSKAQRKLSLQAQYFFNCSCEACESDWPIKAHLPTGIPTFKCGQCSSPLPVSAGSNKKDPTAVNCRECGNVQRPLRYLEKIHESSKSYEKALDRLRDTQISADVVDTFERHIRLMEKYVLLPVSEFAACLSVLKQCYRLSGNTAGSTAHRKV